MTKPIRLRPYRTNDVDAIFDAIIESHAELSRWMPWCHESYSRRETQQWVASQCEVADRLQERSFVIVDDRDQILGSCGIHRLDLINSVAESGYWVRSSATNQGIATAAMLQISDWAFKQAKLHRLELVISVENRPSLRVAEKLGATREGILRQRFQLNDRRHDGVLFSLLNSEQSPVDFQ